MQLKRGRPVWAASLRLAIARQVAVGYHRRMIPRREALTQLARLVGLDLFIERFGSPQTTEAEDEELAALIDGRLAEIARGLIAEAAASDDVLDAASAEEYLEDRLRTLADFFSDELQASLRVAFAESTKDW